MLKELESKCGFVNLISAKRTEGAELYRVPQKMYTYFNERKLYVVCMDRTKKYI